VEHGQEALRDLEALRAELDLDPAALRETLDIALGLGVGRPRLEGPDARGRFRLAHPIPPAWQALVDDVLRLNRTQDTRGALPGLIFDAAQWMQHVGGRPVFRPTRDTVLLHLGHPLLHAALAVFARARFPGRVGAMAATRWTVRHGPVPAGTDALVLLTVEERAVNALRETFHHWVRTLCLPVQHGILGAPLPHVPVRALRLPASVPSPSDITYARELWDEVAPDVRHLVGTLAVALTERVQVALTEVGHVAMTRENERFQSRQGEVSALIAATTLQRLEREIAGLREEADQGVLFDREQRLTALERSIAEKEEEVRRRRAQYDELREQLQRERERVLRHLLPQRYTLRDTAHVFPVAVEIRLPEAQQ
jgi:hypothetical protein